MRRMINFGFVILAPERNVGMLSGTMRSIKALYPEAPSVCVVSKDATPTDMRETKKICPDTWRGRDTITSLINTGIKRGNKGWNMIIMEGARARRCIDIKYSQFIKDEKDILFPIVTDYNKEGRPVRIYKSFPDCTLNGIFIHQTTFKKIGDIPEECSDLMEAKLFWATIAIENGCRFKGILGTKLC